MDVNETDESRRYVDFLERLTAAPEQERAWLTMEFSLQNLPESLRTLVWAAAAPHWFDRDYLAALLGYPPGADDYAALLDLSYVEAYQGRGHAIHEQSRALLLDKLWQTDRKRYRQLAARAAAHCAKQNQGDAVWKVEWIYHRLIAKPAAGAEALIKTGWEWQNPPQFAFDKLEMLARAAEEHRIAGRLERRGAAWALFWQALLDRVYSRYREAKDKLLQIPLFPKQDPNTAAHCLQQLGDAHRGLSEVPQARHCYEQALLLHRTLRNRLGEANCLLSLGHVCLALSETEPARKYLEQALSIYQAIGERVGEANCLRSLGDVCFLLSETESARKYLEQALSIYQAIGGRLGEANCLKSFGDYRRQLQEYETAREKYQAAATLFADIGNREGEAECLEGFAKLHEDQGELGEARETWEQAAALYERLDMPKRAQTCADAAKRLQPVGIG